MRWRLIPILAAIGVLLAQMLGGVPCPDMPIGCGTGDGRAATAADGVGALDGCCDGELRAEPVGSACGADESAQCCCTPAEPALAASQESSHGARGCIDAPLADCKRCGCDVRRAPPTPAPERPSRTVEYKSSPAILSWTTVRQPAFVPSIRAAHDGVRCPLDRGRRRAILSVWVI